MQWAGQELSPRIGQISDNCDFVPLFIKELRDTMEELGTEKERDKSDLPLTRSTTKVAVQEFCVHSRTTWTFATNQTKPTSKADGQSDLILLVKGSKFLLKSCVYLQCIKCHVNYRYVKEVKGKVA